MSKVIPTDSGANFLQRYTTPADRALLSTVQMYDKQVGSEGASSNTVFTLPKYYYPGTNSLMVFVNGQKMEKVTSASDATEYEETNGYTVTFGGSLLDTDVIEFIVVAGYNIDQTEIDTLLGNGSILTGGFKNHIINGNLDFWQRGTGPWTGVTELTADRWRTSYNGGSKSTSRQAFTIGQTDVPNNPKHFLRDTIVTGSGAAGYHIVSQRIEDVTALSGKTVTVSFWAKADAAKNISLECRQNFGTSGSPSASVDGIGVNKFSLTTSWAKYTATFTIPSVSGKTLGTDGNDFFEVRFWTEAGSDYNSITDTLGNQSGTFDFAQIQLENGIITTPFELRPRQTEFALCQRYFQKSYDDDVAPGTAIFNGVHSWHGRSGTTQGCGRPFPTSMRAEPAMVAYSHSSGASGYCYNGTQSADKTCTIYGKNKNGFSYAGVQAGTVADDLMYVHWTADAEL